MDDLKRKRSVAKSSLTRIQGTTEPLTIQTCTKTQLLVRLEKLAEIKAKFEVAQVDIEAQCTDDNLNEQLDERQVFEDKFESVTVKIKELLSKLGPETPTDASHTKPKVNLPKINLPIFEGRYMDWTSYYDLFTALVHNNEGLSSVEKLEYLKGTLKGEPYLLIKNLKTTEANYNEALDQLKKRYENKRIIIQEHVKAIFTAAAVTSESSSNLRKLIDTIQENLRALKVLGKPTENWDTLIYHILCEKLDGDSRRQWELSIKTAEPPKLKQLTDFLEIRCRAIEAAPVSKTKATIPHINTANKQSNKSSTSMVANTSDENCKICHNGVHAIYRCSEFHQMNVDKREAAIKNLELCLNCFKPHHTAIRCTSGTCKKCSKKHNTLLHKNFYKSNKEEKNTAAHAAHQSDQVTTQGSTQVTSQVVTGETPTVCHNHSTTEKQQYVLLSTAIVHIKDQENQVFACRALLDGGSQANFITEKMANRLQLKRKKQNLVIGGIGASTTQSQGLVNIQLSSPVSNFKMKVDAIVIPTITKDLPSHYIDNSNWNYIKHLNLADPEFNIPREIDMLLGAEVVAEIIETEKIVSQNKPAAFNTKLGWILSGKCNLITSQSPLLSTFHSITVDQQIRKFWEIEEVPAGPCWSPEEKAVENHYVKTHVRNEDGTYTVQLPFKNEIPEDFGNSRQRAIQQFLHIEAQLAKDPSRQEQYREFMNEYLLLDHMEPVPPNEVERSNSEVFYIPHHSVLRESSTTTKLRVVFNASAKGSSGKSLNQQLLVGPIVQPELMTLLMRFRHNKIAITADIEKMFRKFWMATKDQDYQRIVWRSSPSEPIQDYRLKTVTYGTAAGPFLATRTLNQLASDEEKNFPSGSKAIKQDFYVDDLISGASSESEALQLQAELIRLLQSGGLRLRKWSSNLDSIIQAVPKEERSIQESQQMIPTESIKTLGILWNPQSDQFSFTVNSKLHPQLTKRIILSEISKLFDPFGWLSPVVIVGKLMIQKLWISGISWDEELPSKLSFEWNNFAQELPALNDLKIDRFVHSQPGCTYELHGFCDSSEKAYGAVIYLKAIQPNGEVIISLLCSKTRVAPLKQISLPRLELCGALILTRLMKWTEDTIKLPEVKVYAWTDSTIVLTWLSNIPRNWKTFVANRVSEIQDGISSENWYHVASQENPADLCSRGISPNQLLESPIWWKGPSWLSSSETHATASINRNDIRAEKEKRSTITMLSTELDIPMLEGFSNLSRLIRITAYCQRFIRNLRTPRSVRQNGFLTSFELKSALHTWIRLVQRKEFNQEISNLQREKDLQSSSRLLTLHPFLDPSGLLRVGGRLENARIKYDQRHPVILPSNHHLTRLIINYEHKRNMHAGPSLLLSILHQQYWILRARSVIRNQLFKCVKCFREKAKVSSQLMGNLPSHRVEPARAFLRSGVDYAGPIFIRSRHGRGKLPKLKAYIVIFICFSTKAIHLELATDCTSASFLAAFRRFVARRGRPAHVYSDCGTNFVGVQPELKELQSTVSSAKFNNNVGSSLAEDNIQWHFNPPAAPNFGGLWEAGVKSTKQHLRRVIGNVILPYEDMLTLLLQIEACLNSRPLCPMSSDQDNFETLTPAHFLIGESFTSLPDPNLLPLNTNRLSRWQLVQQMFQHFWKRWHTEYLHRLQQRPKWTKSSENVKVGDLVLLKEDGVDSLKWPLARVLQTFTGKDGLVRVVSLKTKTGQFQRPISKICPLPTET